MEVKAYDPKVLTLADLPEMVSELRYSPDQPRDKDGKFGEGSGEKLQAYHGTSQANALKIWKQGMPAGGYVTTDESWAHNYGSTKASEKEEGGWAVVTVSHDKSDFESDPEHDDEELGNNAYMTSKAIPKESITGVKFYDEKGKLFKEAKRSEQGDIETRYSPDQPRDDHGRFGEGSGDSSITKPSELGEAKLKSLRSDLKNELEDYSGFVSDKTYIAKDIMLSAVQDALKPNSKTEYGFIMAGDKLVATGGVVMKTDGDARLQNLASLQKGGGTQLIQHLEGIAKAAGAKSIILDSAAEAKGFYVKMGYTPSARYGGDWYEKKLSEARSELRYSPEQERDPNGQFGSGISKDISGAMEHVIGTAAMHALVRVGDKLLDKDGNKVTVKEKGEHTLKVYDHKANDYKELAKSEVGSYTWGSRSELRYSPDQPRDDHGRFGVGGEAGESGKSTEVDSKKGFVKVLHAWQEQDQGSNGMKQAATTAVKVGNAKQPIVAALRKETTGGIDIHRGLTIDSKDPSRSAVLRWKEGQDVNVFPASFSSDHEQAKSFADMAADKDGKLDTKVIITVSGTASDGGYSHGIVIGGRGEKEFDVEKEVITGGQFHVDKIQSTGTGKSRVLNVRLTQTGVF